MAELYKSIKSLPSSLHGSVCYKPSFGFGHKSLSHWRSAPETAGSVYAPTWTQLRTGTLLSHGDYRPRFSLSPFLSLSFFHYLLLYPLLSLFFSLRFLPCTVIPACGLQGDPMLDITDTFSLHSASCRFAQLHGFTWIFFFKYLMHGPLVAWDWVIITTWISVSSADSLSTFAKKKAQCYFAMALHLYCNSV